MKNLLNELHEENTNPPEGAIPLGCPKIIPKMFVVGEGQKWADVYAETIRNKSPKGANAYIRGLGEFYSDGQGDIPIQYYKVKE